MAGIGDVAKLAGVSTATVSRALSGKEHVSDRAKQRVLNAAAELGYVPSHSAYSLATGRNQNIGIVLPKITTWFFSTMVETIQTELINAGYDATLYTLSSGKEQRERIFNDLLLRKRVDAVLTIAVRPSHLELERLNQVGKPIVGVGGPIPGARSYAIDDQEAARLATEHLISLGHTRIGIITASPLDDTEFAQPVQRRMGYEDAMRAAGLEINSAWFGESNFDVAHGYHLAKQFLGDPRNSPSAIFCAADEVAFGAMMAARDLGLRVPEDISIVGIDNHELADFYGLTTVNQDVPGQAAQAARALLEILQSPDPNAMANVEEQHVLPLQLIVRSSTARVRNN